MTTQKYRDSSRSLLSQAKTELAAGDVRQASEKAWGAAAQMVKAIAEQRGWQRPRPCTALRRRGHHCGRNRRREHRSALRAGQRPPHSTSTKIGTAPAASNAASETSKPSSTS